VVYGFCKKDRTFLIPAYAELFFCSWLLYNCAVYRSYRQA